MKQVLVLIGSLLFATSLHAETASLRMRFVLAGDPPAPEQTSSPDRLRTDDVAMLRKRQMIDPETSGIRDVVIYLEAGQGGSKLNLDPYVGVQRRLIAKNARFEPHILLARSGDSLELVDRGPDKHSPNITFVNNPPRGIVLPPDEPNTIPLERPEPAPVPVLCQIHPSMKAYLVVLEHPFVSVSDEDGEICIDGLPVDTDLVFRVFHELGQVEQVKLDGVPTQWRRSRFQLRLSSGDYDLGDVLVPGDTFSH